MQANSSSNLNKKLVDEKSDSSFLLTSQKIEIAYDTRIKAKVKKDIKTILHHQKGLIPASSFTAILGPSGSGKTTLLNFLSNRLMSDNLIVEGNISLNSEKVQSLEPFSKQIAYVEQQDTILGILTPRQCFQFACNLKIDDTKEKKTKIVEDLIQQLGLSSCADTKVGNSYIRGISGGERKRTSIGIELITNPSIIFLDEPTTGLDSTTALQVILLLKDLAREGKTVVSTIHQPSSELFCEFDRLMLLVDGRCIYQGISTEANGFFEKQGYKCPQLMNASEFYLDIMSITDAEDLEEESYEEAKEKHDQKILQFVTNFQQSPLYDFKQNNQLQPVQRKITRQISLGYEFFLITKKSFSMSIFKTIQAVITSLVVFVVFGTIDNSSMQNVRGIVFFITATNTFSGIQGTLAVFSTERSVFLRERFSKSYKTLTYFIARTGINFPFELIYPTASVAIVYWLTSLGKSTFEEFLLMVCLANATYFCAASYGLLYAAVIPKLETAVALVPVLIIPFMLLSGFFLNLEDIHDIRVIFYPIMYLSPFKYGFQAGLAILGKDFQKRTPYSALDNLLILLGIGFALRIISLIAMQIVSNPKRPRMTEVQAESIIEQKQ